VDKGKIWFLLNGNILKTLDIPNDVIEESKRRELKLWIDDDCSSSVDAIWKSVDIIYAYDFGLNIPSITEGNLSGSASKDRYQFTLERKTDVTINLISTKFDAYLYLRDYATDGIIAKDDDGQDEYGWNSRLSLRLDAGTYIIDVTRRNRQAH